MPFRQARVRGDQATQFICDRLEDSGLYVVQSRGHFGAVVIQNFDLVEEPKTFEVVMANIIGNERYNPIFGRNRSQDIYTVPVFYEDEVSKTARVKLINSGKTRDPEFLSDNSLKNYDIDTIKEMLQLRKIEKRVLKQTKRYLMFYREESEDIPEQIEVCTLGDVIADYTHVPEDQRNFAWQATRKLEDVKRVIPVREITADHASRFQSIPNTWPHLVWLTGAEKKPEPVVYPVDEETGQAGFGF
ncbi:hypothetical protein CL619_03915 [archaeon]|nr:hypothetical protein [archaeon]|tara:strand:- start:4509 stop:5243 length:735 start_codon:yes stop_codon:yes gene_type:complete